MAATFALAAFPAAASANTKLGDIAEQVRSADVAFSEALAAARGGDVSELRVALAAEQRFAARARRRAERLSGLRSQARATRLLVIHEDATFNTFAELIDQVPPEVRPALLSALENGAALRDELIAHLMDLAAALPAEMQARVVLLITHLQGDGDIEALVDAISSGALPAGIEAGVQDLVADLSARLGATLADLEPLVGQLPLDVRDRLQAAVERLGEQFADAVEALDAVSTGFCDALGALGWPVPVLCP